MAHWVAKYAYNNHSAVTIGKTKQEALAELEHCMIGKYPLPAWVVIHSLKNNHDAVATFNDGDDVEVAKVFSCNCGSIKRHLK